MSFCRESLQESKMTGFLSDSHYVAVLWTSSHTRDAEVSILHFKRWWYLQLEFLMGGRGLWSLRFLKKIQFLVRIAVFIACDSLIFNRHHFHVHLLNLNFVWIPTENINPATHVYIPVVDMVYPASCMEIAEPVCISSSYSSSCIQIQGVSRVGLKVSAW